MERFWDLINRSESGKVFQTTKFDLHFSQTVAEIVSRYKLKFSPEKVIEDDETVIDNVFDAGVELADKIGGLLNTSTNRLMEISKGEFLAAAESASDQVKLGVGKDARVLFQRQCEDEKKPFICAGMAGTPMNEEEFLLSAIAIAKEEWVDGIDHGMLSEIKGTQVKSGSPLEIRSCRAEVELLFRGLLSAGRPGLHVLDAESSVTGIGGVSVLNNQYLRKTDAQLLFMENELKTNYNILAQVAANLNYGCHNVSLVCPVMGGWCRGPAGTAITAIASVLLTAIPYHASYFLWHPVGTRVIGSTRPDFLWTESVVGQAISKHTKYILLGNVWPNFGAGTQTIFDEIAANTIVNTISALNLLGPSATAAIRPHGTGLEARFMGEISRIIREQGIDRKTGNTIALKYIKRFVDKLATPDLGKPFLELYDRNSLTPIESWADMFYKALDEAKNLIKTS